MCWDSYALGYVKGFYCKITGCIWANAKYPITLMYANFSMSFNFMSFFSKYLPSSVTPIIISQKQECVGPRPEEIQVLVKRFLCSFYIHIETLVKVGVSLILSKFGCYREKTLPLHDNSSDNPCNSWISIIYMQFVR